MTTFIEAFTKLERAREFLLRSATSARRVAESPGSRLETVIAADRALDRGIRAFEDARSKMQAWLWHQRD